MAGNKCDLDPNQRLVSQDQGQNFAQNLGPNIGWKETSAKNNINIYETFADLVQRIKDEQVKKLKEIKKKKKRKCVIC